MENLLPLQIASAGSNVRVRHVGGTAQAVHRLHELGLREGVAMQIVQSGTPCIVQLAGHKLAVRNEDGVVVLVSPNFDAPPIVEMCDKVAVAAEVAR
jgi:Fe2+ transport system protein FeoA